MAPTIGSRDSFFQDVESAHIAHRCEQQAALVQASIKIKEEAEVGCMGVSDKWQQMERYLIADLTSCDWK